MKRFAVSIGNSRVKCAVFEETTLVDQASYSHQEAGDSMTLRNKFLAMGVTEGVRVALCSVVPSLAAGITNILHDFGVAPEQVDVRRGQMPVSYRTPDSLGADRYCAALAARELHGAPVIVVDCGTMLTVNVVDGAGTFIGGSISPGLRTSFFLMHKKTAQLPLLQVGSASLIGRDTAESMRSGVLHLYRHGLTGMLTGVKKQLGCDVPIIVTGGDAVLLTESGMAYDSVDDHLLLRGVIFYLLYVDR